MISMMCVPACEGQDSSNLSVQERDELQRATEPVNQRIGFAVVLPTYLPTALSRDVAADSGPDDEALLVFATEEEQLGLSRVAIPSYLVIIEHMDAEGRICPPCADSESPDYSEIGLRGNVVAEEEVPTGETEVTHDIRFRLGDVHVILQLSWQVPQSTALELTEDMRDEGYRIAESILDES